MSAKPPKAAAGILADWAVRHGVALGQEECDDLLAAVDDELLNAVEIGRAAGFAEAIEAAAAIVGHERGTVRFDDKYALRCMARAAERIRALAPAKEEP